MKTLFKVISQTEAIDVKRQDGTTTQKSIVVLQEIGGKYEDSFVAAMLGNQISLQPNEVVWASLRFSAREYNGTNYMDCTVQEVITMNN